MNFKSKKWVFSWVALVIVGTTLWAVVRQQHTRTNATTYSRFLQQIQSGEVSRATIAASHNGADRVTYQLKSGGRADTIVPSDDRSLLDALKQKMVDVEFRDTSMLWSRVLLNSTPFLLLLAVWFFALARLQSKPGPI
jgi:ATP-dependent Zn protease